MKRVIMSLHRPLIDSFMPNFQRQGKQADSRAGDVVLPYSAPSKHHGQHTHRYLVVVLEQPHGKLAVSAPKHRSHFKVQVGCFPIKYA